MTQINVNSFYVLTSDKLENALFISRNIFVSLPVLYKAESVERRLSTSVIIKNTLKSSRFFYINNL